MGCRITISDGSAQVVLESGGILGIIGLAVQYGNVGGGGTILRFLDGSAARQHRWRKRALTITGEGLRPTGLLDLNYGVLLTVTIETNLGTNVFTGYSLGPTENWTLLGARVTWSLPFEQS